MMGPISRNQLFRKAMTALNISTGKLLRRLEPEKAKQEIWMKVQLNSLTKVLWTSLEGQRVGRMYVPKIHILIHYWWSAVLHAFSCSDHRSSLRLTRSLITRPTPHPEFLLRKARPSHLACHRSWCEKPKCSMVCEETRKKEPRKGAHRSYQEKTKCWVGSEGALKAGTRKASAWPRPCFPFSLRNQGGNTTGTLPSAQSPPMRTGSTWRSAVLAKGTSAPLKALSSTRPSPTTSTFPNISSQILSRPPRDRSQEGGRSSWRTNHLSSPLQNQPRTRRQSIGGNLLSREMWRPGQRTLISTENSLTKINWVLRISVE